ncbi:MAG: DUF2318 domain-containing protein [Clostridiales bacterium]|nr:DUF2318 domain-containing protein [Clostridiales bacterium]
MFLFNKRSNSELGEINNGNGKKEKRYVKGIVCIVLVLLPTLILTACGQKNNAVLEDESTAGNLATEESMASTGEDLVIPVADITENSSFYPVEVDGVAMEVIAVKAEDGSIRTAFNTCQVCFDSGRGYYKQEGNMLVCQNCGNQFSMDRVEVEAGGCNPWPIFDKDQIITEESITIPYSFLQESEQIFANWKR